MSVCTPSALLLPATPSSLVEAMTRIPFFSRCLAAKSAISRSKPGMIWSAISITVTETPFSRRFSATSRPIEPAAGHYGALHAVFSPGNPWPRWRRPECASRKRRAGSFPAGAAPQGTLLWRSRRRRTHRSPPPRYAGFSQPPSFLSDPGRSTSRSV